MLLLHASPWTSLVEEGQLASVWHLLLSNFRKRALFLGSQFEELALCGREAMVTRRSGPITLPLWSGGSKEWMLVSCLLLLFFFFVLMEIDSFLI